MKLHKRISRAKSQKELSELWEKFMSYKGTTTKSRRKWKRAVKARWEQLNDSKSN